jgi:hypothetical protein
MNGGCGTGEIVYFINLNIKRKCDVMPHDFDVGMTMHMGNVGAPPCEVVVHRQNVMPVGEQFFA